MIPASADDIAELLGERADESIVERIANLGPSIEEVREALEEREFQLRFGDGRTPSSLRVEEVRRILDELPELEDVPPGSDDDDEYAGLTLIDTDELRDEP